MKLTFNNKDFVNYLLSPASKLTDNLFLTSRASDSKSHIATLVSSSDNAVILQSSIPYTGEDFSHLIIPEIKTFLRLFSNISDEVITLDVLENKIQYSNTEISFDYHLLDESYYTSKKSLNENKLNALSYDTNFSISKIKISEILKYNSIIPDAEKVYLSTRGDEVYCKIGDNEKPNTNEVKMLLAKSYSGKEISEEMPINIQSILALTFPDVNEISVSVNHDLKIFKFQVNQISYILSGLVR